MHVLLKGHGQSPSLNHTTPMQLPASEPSLLPNVIRVIEATSHQPNDIISISTLISQIAIGLLCDCIDKMSENPTHAFAGI